MPVSDALRRAHVRYLNRLLDDEASKNLLVERARRAKPGTPARGGLLTREQRQFLIMKEVPGVWWPQLTETEKQNYFQESCHKHP